MPLIPSVLSALIQTDMNAKMGAIAGHFPLSQTNPSYFISFCTAIGTGIALGGPTVTFTSSDTGLMGAPPIPGAGSGIGIIIDDSFLNQDLYTRVRNYVISQFGRTTHDPYPPSPGNSGQYLLAMCEGISSAIKSYFSTAWILTSVDPTIYSGSGTIQNGDFTGLVATAIKSQIVSAGPTLLGSFWPTIAQAISESYVATIEQHSTGSLTIVGACIPSVTQICAIPSTGTGTGTAA